MYRVVHFDIMADDTARAVKFYGDVFGWKTEGWPGMDYWLMTTGPDDQPGINGGIGPRRQPSDHTQNSIQVPSVVEFVKKVEAAGGKALTPRMPIPGVGWLAMCTDTEGNTFGLFEEDTAAK
jgi:predicted enzyme related to lactoylglutathione lyase